MTRILRSGPGAGDLVACHFFRRLSGTQILNLRTVYLASAPPPYLVVRETPPKYPRAWMGRSRNPVRITQRPFRYKSIA